MTDQIYGGMAVGRALKEDGVECLFGIHGYINLAIEEACYLGIQMYHFRHEQSAGFAADAYARCLRKPGVCFASASAGTANYPAPLLQAKGALSPLVLLVGVPLPFLGFRLFGVALLLRLVFFVFLLFLLFCLCP